MAFTHEYTNLWRFRDSSGRKFRRMPKVDKVQTLRNYTWWYKRLKSCHKNAVKRLLSSDKGLFKLKEILHTVDGTMMSLILAVPEAFIHTSSASRAGVYTLSDHVMNNLISNLLQDYSGTMRMLKTWKKGLKKAGFEKLPYKVPITIMRRLSWTRPITSFMNKLCKLNSKAKMFRLCVLTQTRSVGLADSKMVRETLQEFLGEVTVKKEFKPDRKVLDAIDQVVDRVVLNAEGISPHFRMSMSTSSCVESKKRDEGKFGFLKRYPDLPELPEFSPENPGGQLTPIWLKAREKILRGDQDVWKTNVCGIRENGKCRVVTSGSFWKDAFLQPFSHLTIEMLKKEACLRDSFVAGRLGWRFIESITHMDPVRGEIIFEDNPIAVSSDWTKATDKPTIASAHRITISLLRKTNLDQDTLRAIQLIWPGAKDLYMNGRFVGTAVNGIPMGDPLTKSNLSITHPISACYADMMWGRHVCAFAGNGDDMILLVAGKHKREWAEAYLDCSRQLGYELSVDDTFITDDWWTYCEEVGRIPLDRFHTVVNANRVKNNALMPYLDIPKIRICIDTRKDREDFSSDVRGKYTLLGKDSEYVKGDEILEGLFSVADAMQDVALGLKYERDAPVFLPRQIFGVGKVPTGWNTTSWTNAINNCRSEYLRDLTITVMQENLGMRDPLISSIKGTVVVNQKHFNGEALVKVNRIPDNSPLKNYVTLTPEQWELFPEGVIEKLVIARELVPESQVSAYYLFQERLQTLEQKVESEDLFSVIKSENIELVQATPKEVAWTVTKFARHFKQAPWLLAYKRKEPLYPKEIIGILSKCDPLRVDIEYDYLKRFQKPMKPDSPYGRSVARLAEWYWDNREKVILGQEYDLPPTEIIADDPIIVADCKRTVHDVVVIVTNDLKLCRLASNEVPQKKIFRISIEDWVNVDADEGAILSALNEVLPQSTIKIIVDQGAFETFLLKTDISGQRYPEWTESVTRLKPLGQEDIYDTYLPPRTINSSNIWELVKLVSKPRAFERRPVVARKLPSWR